MKSLFVSALVVAFLAPAAASASWVDEMMEEVKAQLPHGGGVYTETHSTVSTGGQHAASGQTITTSNSSASSYVETRINADSKGGDIKVKIEQSENENVTTEEYTKKIEPGMGARVEVSATSKSGESKTEVFVDGEEATPQSTSLASTSGFISSESKIRTLFSVQVPRFFKKMFSFLWWL